MTTQNLNRIVSWRTKKTDVGFEYIVFSFDHNVPNAVHEKGTLNTRAKACGRAKKVCKYLRGVANAA